ncbi:hypothetical protein [Rummeliibacillus stabekisii]|uniref:hypothetical protein n=1 Tax=Rummeliibacillus stabekisii TaxID=241244 RepID=UPI00371B6204
MHSALLPNGKIVTAKEFEQERHGVSVRCMDKSCQVPVYYIEGTDDVAAHFKTSGKGDSVHKPDCGFAKKLTFQESVAKVGEFQGSLQEQGIREFVVRLNLSQLDPDYISKTVERGPTEKEKKEAQELDGNALKEKKLTPQSITTIKSIKKLFTTVEPDILASIIISFNGTRIPISKLICTCEEAHAALWNEEALAAPYFVHGTVGKVNRREHVWFITLETGVRSFFTLVVFEAYFKHFTYKDEDLIGKEILAAGRLKKNTFNLDRPITEMVIKSNKFIEFL